MVCIPEEFVPVLEELRSKSRLNTYGTEIQRALIMYAKRKGVECPAKPIIHKIGRHRGPESAETRERRLAKKAAKISQNPV